MREPLISGGDVSLFVVTAGFRFEPGDVHGVASTIVGNGRTGFWIVERSAVFAAEEARRA
jgi:hypothetical protein